MLWADLIILPKMLGDGVKHNLSRIVKVPMEIEVRVMSKQHLKYFPHDSKRVNYC